MSAIAFIDNKVSIALSGGWETVEFHTKQGNTIICNTNAWVQLTKVEVVGTRVTKGLQLGPYCPIQAGHTFFADVDVLCSGPTNDAGKMTFAQDK